MPTDNQTANRGYQLPAAGNDLAYDIARIVAAFQAIDADMAQALVVAGTVALLNSPAFIGTPSAPTAPGGTNTAQIATTAFVQAALNALVSAAPGALDTLNELAAALGDDPNFATTVTNLIAGKAPFVHAHDDRYFTEAEADARFALVGRAVAAGTGLSGGGDLSADRTLAIDKATAAQFLAAAADKVLTPDVAQAAMQPVALVPGANIAVVHSAGVYRTATLDQNSIFNAPTETKVGWPWTVKAKQPAAGGPFTGSWATAYHFGADGAPTLSTAAGAEDLVTFMCTAPGVFTFLGAKLNIG